MEQSTLFDLIQRLSRVLNASSPRGATGNEIGRAFGDLSGHLCGRPGSIDDIPLSAGDGETSWCDRCHHWRVRIELAVRNRQRPAKVIRDARKAFAPLFKLAKQTEAVA